MDKKLFRKRVTAFEESSCCKAKDKDENPDLGGVVLDVAVEPVYYSRVLMAKVLHLTFLKKWTQKDQRS